MSDSRLTEERLRCHLDSNQVMRERLCLSVLPLLGPYSRERPRRPKGGPDGGRDLEAIYEGNTTIWGAVGFRNGGGNDDRARRDASEKFTSDLERAIEENPTLMGFVFFTNVDLTPGQSDQLKQFAVGKGVAIVDVFDIERLRHVLDSPEGMIARLQYLDIAMSATEQIALVNKFGNQLQHAILARFDRVEQTLSQMERFLGFEKPLHRLDFYLSLNTSQRSHELGGFAALLEINGLHALGKTAYFLFVNQHSHPSSTTSLVLRSHTWFEETRQVVTSFEYSLAKAGKVMNSFCELTMSYGGHRVRIADLTLVKLTLHLLEPYAGLINRVSVDANGYEVFNVPTDTVHGDVQIELPNSLSTTCEPGKWVTVLSNVEKNLVFNPPSPSGRYAPLTRWTESQQA